MMTVNADNRKAWHGRARRLGAAVGARPWPRRLAAGIATWVALGIATALLDPRADGVGIIGVFAGSGAWLAAGTGLTVTALLTHGGYRRHGWLAAAAACVLGLAATAVLVALVDWAAVMQTVLGTLLGVAVVYGFLVRGVRPCGRRRVRSSYRDRGDGYRDGPDGVGWYVQGCKIYD